MSGFGSIGGGGGGTGPPGAPGQGVPTGGAAGEILTKQSPADYDTIWTPKGLPTGGATGQVLAKSSNADYDTAWLPGGVPLFTVLSSDLFTVLGTEAVNDRIGPIAFVAGLPPGAFNWIAQGFGYGTYFLMNNAGTAGVPSGGYYVELWADIGAGFQWYRVGSTGTLNATGFPVPDIISRASGIGPYGNRRYHYDPAVLVGIGISFVVAAVPTTAFTLTVGLQGQVVP